MRCAIVPALLILSSLLAYGKDLIILKSGERVLCQIYKEDSLYFYIALIANKKDYFETGIAKSDINYYYTDYTGKVALTAPDSEYIQRSYTEYREARRTQDSIERLRIPVYNSTTFGLGNGGSLLGMDFESAAPNHIGVQAGAGLIGFDFGVNIHFMPDVRSNYISLQLWHVGAPGLFSLILASYTYGVRSNGGVAFQAGLISPIFAYSNSSKKYSGGSASFSFRVFPIITIGYYYAE